MQTAKGLLALRSVLLVEAVEGADAAGELLTHDARKCADAHLEGDAVGSPRAAIVARAKELNERLTQSAPSFTHAAVTLTERPAWLPLALTLLPLSAGWLTHAFSADGAFHVLSPTFVGLIAWNLASLTLVTLSALPRGGAAAPELSPLPSLHAPREDALERIARAQRGAWGARWAQEFALWSTGRLGAGRAAEREALRAFAARWLEATRPLLLARTRQALHLAALCFALGALAGAYWDGLAQAYEATRSSTFLSAPLMERLLSVLLWPSTLLMGPVALQSEGEAMREGLAAAWIHRYALTVSAYVLAPRALLWWAEGRAAARAAARAGEAPLAEPTLTLNVALAAHTNEGKTSIVRTLLRRDVGEVRDGEHTTQARAAYFLARTDEGRVRLWDTPGFKNAYALDQALNRPDAWEWLKGQAPEDERRYDYEAARALREEADVILYVLPAAPTQEQERQVSHEWRILKRVGVPVIALLNKLNDSALTPDASDKAARAAEALWRERLKGEGPLCRAVISLDAFSRSLRDELLLFKELEEAAPPNLRALAAAARAHKERELQGQQHALRALLAAHLAALARDREPLAAPAPAKGRGRLGQITERIKEGVKTIFNADRDEEATQKSRDAIWARAHARKESTTAQICDIFGLEGQMRLDLERLSDKLLVSKERDVVDHKHLGIWGAVISGLSTGLAADAMAGGLTLGGGLIAGGLLGLLAGLGAAEVKHLLSDGGALRWDDKHLLQDAASLLSLCALCARFGRARGSVSLSESELKGGVHPLDGLIKALQSAEHPLLAALRAAREEDSPAAPEALVVALHAPLDAALSLTPPPAPPAPPAPQ
ncbi:MAG: hypothetical protein FJ138_04060 [Deltaproteobacteria bacterium]|nr:hypothetical protein [Deltaproteobacteria bacterium]